MQQVFQMFVQIVAFGVGVFAAFPFFRDTPLHHGIFYAGAGAAAAYAVALISDWRARH